MFKKCTFMNQKSLFKKKIIISVFKIKKMMINIFRIEFKCRYLKIGNKIYKS